MLRIPYISRRRIASSAAKSVAKRKTMQSNTNSTVLETLKLFVELVKVLAWPAIVVGAFLMFRQPIEAIVEDLPLKFSQASKVGVGALTLEIQQQAKAAGNPQLAMRLGKLSPEAIKLLIEVGESRVILVGEYINTGEGKDKFTIPTVDKLKVVRELEENGLIDYEEDLDSFFTWIQSPLFEVVSTQWDYKIQSFKSVRPLLPAELERLKKQSYRLNKLGKKAWQTVLYAVLEQLRIPTQGVTKKKSPAMSSGEKE